MVLKINRRKLKELYIALFLFVLIFAPPVLPQINLILAVLCCGMIFLKYQKTWSSVFKKSGQLQWCFTILFLFIYAFSIILINAAFFNEQVQLEHYTALFNRFIVLTLSVVPSSLYIICFMKKNAFSQDDFIKGVVRAGLLQVVCVFASFFSNEIKSFFIYFMKTFGGSSLYDNTWYITVRSYGFARTLVDLFGLGMGLIAGISFFYGLYKEKRYIVYSLLIAMAGVLNARTTVIIYALAILCCFVYSISKMKLKILLKSIVYVVLAIICVINILPLIEIINRPTYTWLLQALNSITDFVVDEEVTGTFSVLFSENFWQIPEPFQVIFGSGHSLYNAGGYAHSDVGYINDMWFVGIVGMCLLYGSIALLITQVAKKNQNSMYKMCMFFLGISVLVFNIKGSVIGFNPGAATMFCVIFTLRYLSQTEKKM